MGRANIYKIKGMHCASCVGIIEKALKKVEGVHSTDVNFGTESARIEFDESKTNPHVFAKAIEHLGYTLVIPRENSVGYETVGQLEDEKQKELADMKRGVLSVVPLAILSIGVMGWEIAAQLKFIPDMTLVWKEFFHHLLPLIATYALFVVGKPYVRGVYRFVRYGKANMDTLIGIGTSVAYAYSFILTAFEETLLKSFPGIEYTYYDVTVVVIAFITLGKYLEAQSKAKTGDAIEKLFNLQAKTAIVLRDAHEMEMPIDQVVVGDVLAIKPAGKIPVDGVVIEGTSYVDESMITGEPIPVQKNIGDAVAAGTINTSGSFLFRATKIGSETLLANIIKMVRAAQGSRAPIQALADRISSVFVPVVLVLALIALGAWIVVGSVYLGFSQAFSYGLMSMVGILVIACPCALGLATPTAIIVGVGKGAREGILVKDAATLEKLHTATIIVMDKTGTITKGKPELVSIKNFSKMSDDDFITILASLESKSEHPIAHAIVSYAREKNVRLMAVAHFDSLNGRGLKGVIEKSEYYVGSCKLIVDDMGMSFNTKEIEQETVEGKTPIILATKKGVLGVVMVADAIKPEAPAAIVRLRKLGIRVMMLTGDDHNTATYIAKQANIEEVVAGVLPQDKLKKIQDLQSQGEVVVMAGDGVNDAPALAQADVGIAMATGTDAAIESAGITLLHGDISKIVKAIVLSKMTMRGIKQNLFWAFIYNIIGIPLAGGLFYPLFGWLLNPVFAGAAMAFSSVSVVGNSLRLKSKKL